MAQRMSEFGPSQMGSALDGSGASATLTVATFMYARMHNFSAVCNAMGPDEAAAFVTEVRRMLTEGVTKLGGEVAQRRPDSILAVFSNKPDQETHHRATRTACGILAVHEAVQLAQAIATRAELANLAALTLASACISAPPTVAPRLTRQGPRGSATPSNGPPARSDGDDMNWSVAATTGTHLPRPGAPRAAASARWGCRTTFQSTWSKSAAWFRARGRARRRVCVELLRESLQANQQARKRASSAARRPTRRRFGHALPYRRLPGAAQDRRGRHGIDLPGAGRAGRTAAGAQGHALDNRWRPIGLQRFIQEYALLAQIEHPNVARIFRQTFRRPCLHRDGVLPAGRPARAHESRPDRALDGDLVHQADGCRPRGHPRRRHRAP